VSHHDFLHWAIGFWLLVEPPNQKNKRRSMENYRPKYVWTESCLKAPVQILKHCYWLDTCFNKSVVPFQAWYSRWSKKQGLWFVAARSDVDYDWNMPSCGITKKAHEPTIHKMYPDIAINEIWSNRNSRPKGWQFHQVL
jgi:hypothetical protein